MTLTDSSAEADVTKAISEHKQVHESAEFEKKRTILVPLDATDASPKTIQWISNVLVQPESDLVVLFSVYRSAAHDLPIGRGYDFEVTMCRQLNEKGIHCKGIIAMGDPRQLIDHQITASKADIVVMAKSKKADYQADQRALRLGQHPCVAANADSFESTTFTPFEAAQPYVFAQMSSPEHSTITEHPNDGTAKTRVVLVPLEPTENAQKNLQWIIGNLANPKTDLLVLFTVYRSAAHDLPINTGLDFGNAVKSLNQEYAQRAERFLLDLAKDVAAKGIHCKAVVCKGDIKQGIDEEIKACNADMVVVGKSKSGPLKAFGLMGNIATHKTPLPVLADIPAVNFQANELASRNPRKLNHLQQETHVSAPADHKLPDFPMRIVDRIERAINAKLWQQGAALASRYWEHTLASWLTILFQKTHCQMKLLLTHRPLHLGLALSVQSDCEMALSILNRYRHVADTEVFAERFEALLQSVTSELNGRPAIAGPETPTTQTVHQPMAGCPVATDTTSTVTTAADGDSTDYSDEESFDSVSLYQGLRPTCPNGTNGTDGTEARICRVPPLSMSDQPVSAASVISSHNQRMDDFAKKFQSLAEVTVEPTRKARFQFLARDYTSRKVAPSFDVHHDSLPGASAAARELLLTLSQNPE
ncbi:hypothetical protein HDV03_002552 [Kappamyces sp. JEL0829]|nr:hypothetical protein HDV03_002552 [Kappamyces sp. JEL0829]